MKVLTALSLYENPERHYQAILNNLDIINTNQNFNKNEDVVNVKAR